MADDFLMNLWSNVRLRFNDNDEKKDKEKVTIIPRSANYQEDEIVEFALSYNTGRYQIQPLVADFDIIDCHQPINPPNHSKAKKDSVNNSLKKLSINKGV